MFGETVCVDVKFETLLAKLLGFSGRKVRIFAPRERSTTKFEHSI